MGRANFRERAGLWLGRGRETLGRKRSDPAVPQGLRGAPRLVPAPGGISWFDEGREGISLFRTATAGRVGTKWIHEGALVLVARRDPQEGELLVIARRDSLRLSEVPPGHDGEGRIIGVVEGIISAKEKPRRPLPEAGVRVLEGRGILTGRIPRSDSALQSA